MFVDAVLLSKYSKIIDSIIKSNVLIFFLTSYDLLHERIQQSICKSNDESCNIVKNICCCCWYLDVNRDVNVKKSYCHFL